MLEVAQMAESTGVELLAVGVELFPTHHLRNEWRDLIDDIRRVYFGDLFTAYYGCGVRVCHSLPGTSLTTLA